MAGPGPRRLCRRGIRCPAFSVNSEKRARRNRPMADKPRYYITTAISYPNGPPHIGHAYEAIAADAIARFQRSQGRDVRFQTGTDEHGLKMAQAARAEGVEPRAFATKMSQLFQDMCDVLNVSYDR